MDRRTEKEMLQLILAVAERLDAVRGVILQGSRANPNAPRDEWQDYDVVYLVSDLKPLLSDYQWIDQFGERIILQMPETIQLLPPADNGGFAFLMLFTDGNRIDLTLTPKETWQSRTPDSLSVLLLDKDGDLSALPEPTERDYYPAQPTEKHFQDCCNEFWWTSAYVAKGLQRKELTYAKAMQERVVRPMLEQMIIWQIRSVYGPEVNPGKHGKYFQQFLSADQWQQLQATYTDGNLEHSWSGLFRMIALFEELSIQVATYFDLSYRADEAKKVTNYLKQQFHNRTI